MYKFAVSKLQKYSNNNKITNIYSFYQLKLVMKSKNIQATSIAVNSEIPTSWMRGIIALTFFLYIPSFQFLFTNWDDPQYVTSASGKLSDVLTQTVLGNYHPLTMLSLWLNFQISGLKPMSYHLFNVLLHLANVYLVFLFIWRLSEGKKWTTIIVSLFFAIHPMHVESVAWVAERKDVLYTFFFFLACLQYLEYIKNESNKSLLLTFLFFILSLLSKPAAVIFPIALLLLDYYYSRKKSTKSLIISGLFFATSLIFGIITYNIQSIEAIRTIDEHGIINRFWFFNHNLMMYFIKGLVPFGMSAAHPFPTEPLPIEYLLSPIFTLGFLYALFHFRKNKAIVFGLLFFFVNLILVLQVITIGQTVMADRYTYVPHIGLFFAIAYFFEYQWINENKRSILQGALALLTLFFVFQSYQYIKTWKDGQTVWSNVIEHYPKSEAGYYNRGKFFDENNQHNEAVNDYTKLLEINPKHIEGATNRGRILMRYGKFKEAHADFESAQKQTTDSTKLGVIILNRSYAYFYEGNRAKALEVAKEAQRYGAKVEEKYWAEINK